MSTTNKHLGYDIAFPGKACLTIWIEEVDGVIEGTSQFVDPTVLFSDSDVVRVREREGRSAHLTFLREEIVSGGELERFVLYKTCYSENEGGRVMREVWFLPNGRALRRSVDRSFNETLGSLRGEATNPDDDSDWRRNNKMVERTTAQVFDEMWDKAIFPDRTAGAR